MAAIAPLTMASVKRPWKANTIAKITTHTKPPDHPPNHPTFSPLRLFMYPFSLMMTPNDLALSAAK